MKPEVPRELLRLAEQWDELHRWERSELGKALRRLGLTYREIQAIVPVPKGTLSGWCRDVELTCDQVEAIKLRVPSQRGVPNDSQWRRRQEIQGVQADARQFAESNQDDAYFIAGVVLYWAEGSKTRNDLVLANTDPAVLRLFVCWTRTYLEPNAEFRLSLHLHEGNDESLAMRYWRGELDLPVARFTKTYIKPAGTGHRKNHLEHGVCRVRVCKSADHWHRTMAWIEWARSHYG